MWVSLSRFDPANDCVNAVGAFDYDFKIRVNARSRSTLGSSALRVGSSVTNVHNIQIITTSSDRAIESRHSSITLLPNVPATCLCQSGLDNSSVKYLSDQYCISNEPSVGDTDATDETHSAISLSANMLPDGSSRSKSSSMTGLPVSLATASCRNKISPAPNSGGKWSADSEKRPLRSSSINSVRHALRMAIQSPA